MATEQQYQDALDRLAAMLDTTVSNLAGALAANPQLAEDLIRQIGDMTMRSSGRTRRSRSRRTAARPRWPASVPIQPSILA